jgi:hypothetical protein
VLGALHALLLLMVCLPLLPDCLCNDLRRSLSCSIEAALAAFAGSVTVSSSDVSSFLCLRIDRVEAFPSMSGHIGFEALINKLRQNSLAFGDKLLGGYVYLKKRM